jgi:hypothetical protein
VRACQLGAHRGAHGLRVVSERETELERHVQCAVDGRASEPWPRWRVKAIGVKEEVDWAFLMLVSIEL